MRIAVVAGEASGDALGETLIQAVRSHFPNASFAGIAGPRMQALGARSLYPMETLAVRGYVEVLRSLPRLLWIRAQLRRHFLAPGQRPDLFVGIDAPDFNLGLAHALKDAGIPTLQMVAPTVWAWRAGRLPRIRAAVDGILSIFPFERSWFESAGIPIFDLGHPLASQLPLYPARESARRVLGVDQGCRAVALLPGSRRSELVFHSELMGQVAQRLQVQDQRLECWVPLVDEASRAQFISLTGVRQDSDGWWRTPNRRPGPGAAEPSPRLRLWVGQARTALEAADVALVASGTATLEAALLKCPHVITYRLSGLTAWWVRRQRVNSAVGLPNIILGRAVVPELLQEQAQPEILAGALQNLLDHPSLRSQMVQDFAQLHQLLRGDAQAGIGQALHAVLRTGFAATN